MATTYTARDITVLEGLEPVRKRPGMYIGGVDARGLHHLVNEIVDNAIDEVINGYATRLEVTLFTDGREIEVADNGRGIPVDVHPKYKKSALELILTTLHAGGKFDQGNYVHSGGLHGVGASVVCALSSEMTVARAGATAPNGSRRYARGKATSKVGEDLGRRESARLGHDGALPARPGHLRQARVRRRGDPRAPRGARRTSIAASASSSSTRPRSRRGATSSRTRAASSDWLTHVVAERGKATRREACSSSRARASPGSSSRSCGPRRPTSTCART